MKHSFKLLFVICAGLLAGLLAACGGGGTATSPEVVAFNCQGSYTGRIDAPAQDVRLANRDRQLAEGGPLGGGVDGGIYLEGAFGWETGPMVDGVCPIIAGEALIHGQHSGLHGVVMGDGEFAFSHDGGPVTGKVTGSAISGKLAEGGGREWVYGVLVGAFTAGGHI